MTCVFSSSAFTSDGWSSMYESWTRNIFFLYLWGNSWDSSRSTLDLRRGENLTVCCLKIAHLRFSKIHTVMTVDFTTAEAQTFFIFFSHHHAAVHGPTHSWASIDRTHLHPQRLTPSFSAQVWSQPKQMGLYKWKAIEVPQAQEEAIACLWSLLASTKLAMVGAHSCQKKIKWSHALFFWHLSNPSHSDRHAKRIFWA